MPDSPEPSPADEQANGGDSEWDAVEVLRGRAAESREERDKAIAQLRETMTDEEILDNFGIDLPEIDR
jgi:hypothetical protein